MAEAATVATVALRAAEEDRYLSRNTVLGFWSSVICGRSIDAGWRMSSNVGELMEDGDVCESARRAGAR